MLEEYKTLLKYGSYHSSRTRIAKWVDFPASQVQGFNLLAQRARSKGSSYDA